MPSLISNLQYNDPLTIISRKGTTEDPYINRADSLPIINGIITLLEIPSYTDKVTISGFTEIDQEIYETRPFLEPNEFLVHYGTGVIQFHTSLEGTIQLCRYKGRGIIMYPASRIYAMISRQPDVVKTLQDIIDEVLLYISTYSEKLIQINQAITEATHATTNANIATDNANIAAKTALDAADDALTAIRNAMKIYKPPVNVYNGLATSYPKPELGWTVMVRTTGDIYRWDGTAWVLIENFTQMAFPTASANLNGLMSKEDYVAVHEKLNIRSIMFSLGKPKLAGIPPLLFSFPYSGEIKNIKAYCIQAGVLVPTEIEIQKISTASFLNGSWTNILNDNVLFNTNEKLSTTHTIKEKTVNLNDYFRLNILNVDQEIQGITIQIDIQI
ncbi:hypothetical protein [Paenibacillus illinoisensis]|uniref:Excinuclease ABC n=1 Tax=Paenibacillus illinoisensis TaxID=59845 RepID=A0A2W0C7F9_9BACL|nr:hypothetical protein [Paenibacillus illinoisensis]PYY28386.1 Excinuclease ABC [Paenibacillus illinoisensis]